MFNYLLTSTLLHTVLLLLLATPGCINLETSRKIEVNIREVSKSDKNGVILPPSRKYAKLRERGGRTKKQEKVDLTSYTNRLKAAIDPVWFEHVHPLEAHLLREYTTIVLLMPDKYGNIVSVKVIKSSGDSTLDALAIQTFREVKQIPIPPESLIKDGIEWEFVVGKRSYR